MYKKNFSKKRILIHKKNFIRKKEYIEYTKYAIYDIFCQNDPAIK